MATKSQKERPRDDSGSEPTEQEKEAADLAKARNAEEREAAAEAAEESTEGRAIKYIGGSHEHKLLKSDWQRVGVEDQGVVSWNEKNNWVAFLSDAAADAILELDPTEFRDADHDDFVTRDLSRVGTIPWPENRAARDMRAAKAEAMGFEPRLTDEKGEGPRTSGSDAGTTAGGGTAGAGIRGTRTGGGTRSTATRTA